MDPKTRRIGATSVCHADDFTMSGLDPKKDFHKFLDD